MTHYPRPFLAECDCKDDDATARDQLLAEFQPHL
jgi:hypothetical protein